jgi:lysophospholipase L1-like esterase
MLFVKFIALLLIIYIAYTVIRMRSLIAQGKRKAIPSKPYFRVVKDTDQHILILGDSTMYGAGIKDPNNAMGALLGAKYPAAGVETHAANGEKIKDLHNQLKKAHYKHYDIIVIGIGGNDIIRFSRYTTIQRELTAFLEEASQIAKQIILCHCVNVGNIGFFRFPLNYIYDYRTRKLSHLYTKIVTQFPKTHYVNFYRPKHNDHYTKTTRKKFIADDSFHPSDYSNQYFFDLIWKEIQIPRS